MLKQNETSARDRFADSMLTSVCPLHGLGRGHPHECPVCRLREPNISKIVPSSKSKLVCCFASCSIRHRNQQPCRRRLIDLLRQISRRHVSANLLEDDHTVCEKEEDARAFGLIDI